MLHLHGNAAERGAQQAARVPESAQAVRDAVRLRLDRAVAAGHLDDAARDFLADQRRLTAGLMPEALAEVAGIAAGFGVAEDDLFSYLHLGTLADLAHGRAPHEDGCTAWAVRAGPDGPLAVKNRDFRGEHLGLQAVMLHVDPAWNGRRTICVGSLGSPGAYSSGMNSDGLALVDTQVATTDHAPGILRYFLMTRLLTQCRSVSEALHLIAELPHAGGGTLVLADADGAIAAVELGTEVQSAEHGPDWVARTNHFVSGALAATTIHDSPTPAVGDSRHRLETLRTRLPGRVWDIEAAKRLMAEHDEGGAWCRHGQDGESRTISNVVFACAARMLHLTEGYACSGRRRSFAFPE